MSEQFKKEFTPFLSRKEAWRISKEMLKYGIDRGTQMGIVVVPSMDENGDIYCEVEVHTSPVFMAETVNFLSAELEKIVRQTILQTYGGMLDGKR